MKKTILLAASALLLPISAAQAATTVTAEVADAPYSGPTPTYDFSSEAPITGGSFRTGSDSVATVPFGTDGDFYAVGPLAGTPAILSLAAFGSIGQISLSWGSVDTSNLLEVLDSADNILASISGTQIQGLVGTAGQFFAPGALVTLNFTDETVDQVSALRFSSNNNSFEFDNVAVAPVPEPSVWMMMLLGFAALGFSLRRKEKAKLRVRFA